MSGPRVRIVHPGGPGCMAQVWIDDQQLTCVTRVEISPIDPDHLVTATLTIVDPEIALEAELAELYVRELPQLPAETAHDGMTVIAHVAQDMTAPVSNSPAPAYWINS